MRDAAASGIPAALADLGGLVRIPSIAFPGFDASQVQRSAEAVAALVEGLGLFETVEIRRAAIPGSDDEARARLGDYFAEVLLLDQGTDAAKARADLDWRPSRPGLVEEFRQGSYRKVAAG